MNLTVSTGTPLAKLMEREIKGLARAVKQSVGGATVQLQTNLRQDVQGAGLGPKVANAWRSKVFPPGQDSTRAASLVYTKAPNIIDAFASGNVIRGRRRRSLAIPTQNAPRRLFGKRVTPALMEKAGYDLDLEKTSRGRLLLVAKGLRAAHARATGQFKGFRRANAKQKRSGRGAVSVVMFVLVTLVQPRKRLDLVRRADQAQNDLASRIYAYTGPKGVGVE